LISATLLISGCYGVWQMAAAYPTPAYLDRLIACMGRHGSVGFYLQK
jgi:hypothetical protein